MTKTARARYTLEFKQEAVRLVQGGQSRFGHRWHSA
ncbi:transposase-like protein [Variovorax sp. GrIS 2.14]|jgi:transposase